MKRVSISVSGDSLISGWHGESLHPRAMRLTRQVLTRTV